MVGIATEFEHLHDAKSIWRYAYVEEYVWGFLDQGILRNPSISIKPFVTGATGPVH